MQQRDDDIDLMRYVRSACRYWWTYLLALCVLAAIVVIRYSNQEPRYVARAMMMIDTRSNAINSELTDSARAAWRVVAFGGEGSPALLHELALLNSMQVLESVVTSLDMAPVTEDEAVRSRALRLYDEVRCSAVSLMSDVVNIEYADVDPERAVAVVDTLIARYNDMRCRQASERGEALYGYYSAVYDSLATAPVADTVGMEQVAWCRLQAHRSWQRPEAPGVVIDDAYVHHMLTGRPTMRQLLGWGAACMVVPVVITVVAANRRRREKLSR